jgi:4-hydroxybenzoyl-CoA thioesterase
VTAPPGDPARHERAVGFDEVDAAGIVFFARYAGWAHEAMERFFGQLAGGYARLITERRIGLPAVRFEMEFSRPLRYGETLVVETAVERIGSRSATLRYTVRRAEEVARMRHVVVSTDLDRLASVELPDDVRAALAAHPVLDSSP